MASEWTTTRLGQVVAINPDVIGRDWPYPHIRYIDISSVGVGQIKASPQWMKVSDAPSRAKRLVRKGDTVLSTVRPNRRSMFFASQPISYNLDDFEEWIDTVMVLNKAPPEKLRDFVKPPSYFLCFAQCEPFYWFFGGEIIDKKDLPVKWFDYSGPSFRWESGGLRGIERLVEFHRIEVVWMGEPDQVVEIRNQLLDRYEYFMDKVLDLEWRWAWVTPFYLEHAGEARDIKEVGELDINQPGTIDFEAWLPYKGPRDDKDSWLEIGNISIHGTKYTSSFKIKHNKRNRIIWTGCSGFGTQRWLLAFLAQKGFDPDNWPEEVAKDFRKPPEGFITVTYPKTAEGKELYREILNMLSKLS